MKNLKGFEQFINEDLMTEKKKMNAGLKAYLDKKAGKDDKDKDKDDKKDEKDKNGDCECDCKKNCDEKEEKGEKKKGLTPAQKKLPEGLQKAILAKQKK